MSSIFKLPNGNIVDKGDFVEGVDLSGVDAPGIVLTNKILRNIILTNANLPGANFMDAKLSGAKFIHADLTGASFKDAMLVGVDFKYAILINAILTNAKMMRVDFTGADLTNAILTDSILTDAIVSGVSFRGADLRWANLSGLDLSGLDFSNTKLQGANLSGAIFSGANLSGATLYGPGSDNGVDEIVKANISGTIFDNVEWTNADISNLHFTIENKLTSIDSTTIKNGTGGIDDIYVIYHDAPHEVHNKYYKLMSKEQDILRIIGNTDDETYESMGLIEYIIQQFVIYLEEIRNPITESEFEEIRNPITESEFQNILQKYEEMFEKIFDLIEELNPRYKRLIYECVRFAFSQGKDFKEIYFKIFMDESCNAYGENGMSCPEGIIERLVLSIGATVQVLCIIDPTCGENPQYVELNRIFNTEPVVYFKLHSSEIIYPLYEEYTEKYSELNVPGNVKLSPNYKYRYRGEIMRKMTDWVKQQDSLVENPHENIIQNRIVSPGVNKLIKKNTDELIDTIFQDITYGGRRKIKRSRRIMDMKQTKRYRRIKSTKRLNMRRKSNKYR